MKKLLFFLVCFPFLVKCQGKIQISSLESKKLLTLLFEAKSFNKNEGLWLPRIEDKLEMNVSDDGYCHTKLDTIIYVSIENQKTAITLFSTSEYQNNHKVNFHGKSVVVSAATFIEEGGIWTLVSFKKQFDNLGSWGERGGVFGLKKLGENLNCLFFKDSGFGNQGAFISNTYFYSLEKFDNFKVVFSYQNSFNNEASMMENKYDEVVELKTIPTDYFYKIELTSFRNKKLFSKTYFKYNENEGKFTEQKKQ